MTQKSNKIQSPYTIINYLSLLTDFETKSRDLGTAMQAQKTSNCYHQIVKRHQNQKSYFLSM